MNPNTDELMQMRQKLSDVTMERDDLLQKYKSRTTDCLNRQQERQRICAQLHALGFILQQDGTIAKCK